MEVFVGGKGVCVCECVHACMHVCVVSASMCGYLFARIYCIFV